MLVGMAAPDDDLERLLREVDASLSAAPAKPSGVPATTGGATPARQQGEQAGGRFAVAVRAGLIGGAITGGLVFLIFMLAPFVGAWGPGVGAFVGGFLNGFYFKYRSTGG